MKTITKLKLITFCLSASVTFTAFAYMEVVDCCRQAYTQADKDKAFEVYTHFAKQMKEVRHKQPNIFSVVDKE